MSTETALRDHLVKLLTSAWAHVTAEDGIAGVPPDQRGARLPSHPHTIWQLLEHLRNRVSGTGWLRTLVQRYHRPNRTPGPLMTPQGLRRSGSPHAAPWALQKLTKRPHKPMSKKRTLFRSYVDDKKKETI